MIVTVEPGKMICRPRRFRINPCAPLNRGALFEGFGYGAGTRIYHDGGDMPSRIRRHGILTNMIPATASRFSSELGRPCIYTLGVPLEYVAIPNDWFNTPRTTCSVVFWVKILSTAGMRILCGRGGGVGFLPWTIQLVSTNGVGWNYKTSVRLSTGAYLQPTTTGYPLIIGNWHSIGLTYDGQTCRNYLDKQQQSSESAGSPTTLISGAGSIYLPTAYGETGYQPNAYFADLLVSSECLCSDQLVSFADRSNVNLDGLIEPIGGISRITLPLPTWTAKRGDSIRVKLGSVEVDQLRTVGSIPGVRVDRVGGLNGPGKARLRYRAGAGLSWAPPDADYGFPVPMGGDGAYLLEGASPGRFARVTVWEDHLRDGAEAPVFLADRWNNGVSHDDVTAAEASAGDVETYQLELVNESEAQVGDLRVWLDAATEYLEISDDNSTWVSPTTEAAALEFGNVDPAGSVTLYLRRTIPASEPYDPEVLSHLHAAFTG